VTTTDPTTTDPTTTEQTTTETKIETSQRTRTPSILLLGAVTALPALSIDAYLPALPSLARDLGTTPAAAQLTLTAVLLGIALGQLIGGPLSDRFGRRIPLLAGLATFVVAAGLCAVAPNLPALVALRLLMGLGGGAAVVVARAVVRDRADGARAARMFARLMLVMGVVPVLAPVLGAQLLRVTTWRGVFAGLVVLGVVLGAVVVRRLPETLEEPATGGPLDTLRAFGGVLRDRAFVGYALAAALTSGALFAYVSASPFVLEDVYGLSPAAFSVVFAMNAAALISASQLSARLVGRTGPRRLLLVGLGVAATAGIWLLLVALTDSPLPLLLGGLFAMMASFGFISPNATALALQEHGAQAGTASALIGLGQFVTGAVAAPLTGIVGGAGAMPLAVVVAAFAVTGAAASLLTRSRRLALATT
jgi:DHA1 family bicyclomycin/chloramphenicol resistance-like MFS transporter